MRDNRCKSKCMGCCAFCVLGSLWLSYSLGCNFTWSLCLQGQAGENHCRFCTGLNSALALIILIGPFQLRMFCHPEFSILFTGIRLWGSVHKGHQPWGAGGSSGVAPGKVCHKLLPLLVPQRCCSGPVVWCLWAKVWSGESALGWSEAAAHWSPMAKPSLLLVKHISTGSPGAEFGSGPRELGPVH